MTISREDKVEILNKIHAILSDMVVKQYELAVYKLGMLEVTVNNMDTGTDTLRSTYIKPDYDEKVTVRKGVGVIPKPNNIQTSDPIPDPGYRVSCGTDVQTTPSDYFPGTWVNKRVFTPKDFQSPQSQTFSVKPYTNIPILQGGMIDKMDADEEKARQEAEDLERETVIRNEKGETWPAFPQEWVLGEQCMCTVSADLTREQYVVNVGGFDKEFRFNRYFEPIDPDGPSWKDMYSPYIKEKLRRMGE